MRIPIRLKFSLLTLLLIAVTTGVILWFTLSRVRAALADEIHLQGEILTRVIALNAEDPLITGDDLYLAGLAADAVKNEGVGYAYIVDLNGKIRAHQQIEYVGRPESLYRPPAGLSAVNRPILLAGKKTIGRVMVGMSLERIRTTTGVMQVVLVIISVAGLLLGILGALLLANYLIRPIHQLADGVREIAAGNLDQEIKSRSDDELGDLTAAFNQMARSLKEKEQIKDAFRRYVSHQVAEEIFKNPEKYVDTLRGARRKVTVLFADIRGFTPLAERLPAEEAVALLNEVLTSMTDIIFRWEGTLDKFIGDCIMAVFGSPVRHRDDTNRAIHAAVDIQKRIEQVNGLRTRAGKIPIHIGIGINTGEAVVGNIGSKDRLDYTVIGDSVNLASRLQEVARGGEIIVSETVFAEARVPYKYSEPMLIKVKGKEAPVKIYQVLP